MIQFQIRSRPELPAAPHGNHRPQDYPRTIVTSMALRAQGSRCCTALSSVVYTWAMI
jgi:hypothetical protein